MQRHPRATFDLVKEDFDFGCFVIGEIGVAPFEDEPNWRLPDLYTSILEHLRVAVAFEAFEEPAALAWLEHQGAGMAPSDAMANAAAPPDVRLAREDVEGGGALDGDSHRH